MRNREEYNAYMKAYQQRKRETKTMLIIKRGMTTAHQSRLKKTENISDRNRNYIIG